MTFCKSVLGFNCLSWQLFQENSLSAERTDNCGHFNTHLKRGPTRRKTVSDAARRVWVVPHTRATLLR